ncbi:MAG TPA: hypothetical protein VFE05_04455, partial [Longimicrobiaceae bacterium]|nr:hypothetical protein [Longimicrobiaceae bacterium]
LRAAVDAGDLHVRACSSWCPPRMRKSASGGTNVSASSAPASDSGRRAIFEFNADFERHDRD